MVLTVPLLFSQESRSSTDVSSDDEDSSSLSSTSSPLQQHRQQHLVASVSQTKTIIQLKKDLRSLLIQHGGCPKHPDVQKVIDQLTELNPSKDLDCITLPSFLGEFTALTAPNWPGRIEPMPQQKEVDNEAGKCQDIKYQYKLGRLSFNIFQPNNLVCTLRSVRNLVMPTTDEKHGDDRCTLAYPLVSDIIIHTPEGIDLPATLINEAICYENTDVKNRVMASFSGGTLMPANQVKTDSHKMKIWTKTFEGAYSKAAEEMSYVGRTVQFILKSLLGLTLPKDIDSTSLLEEEHAFHFEMKRSPVGYLDILYLDDDIRITKGNRGTIVVVERSELYSSIGRY